jgi:thiamine-monophosphate kinase
MNEAHIIQFLKGAFPEEIGDDAAVIQQQNTEIVISKDLLIEEVHFRRRYQTPESLAYKALAVNLSDIAAMGAQPFAVFLGLAAHPEDGPFVDIFLESFVSACKNAQVKLLGGDTTRAPSKKLYLSLTILGRALSPHQLKHRHTAQSGDIIFVAGPLGYAHIGFTALEKNVAGYESYKDHFLNPKARIDEGLWLSTQSCVHAMMDISDGLWIDLQKLVQASQHSAKILLENFSFTDADLVACQNLGLSDTETRLTGGEDYSLLFTVHPQQAEKIRTQFQENFGYPLIKIGEITAAVETTSVQIYRDGAPCHVALNPFDHFKRDQDY